MIRNYWWIYLFDCLFLFWIALFRVCHFRRDLFLLKNSIHQIIKRNSRTHFIGVLHGVFRIGISKNSRSLGEIWMQHSNYFLRTSLGLFFQFRWIHHVHDIRHRIYCASLRNRHDLIAGDYHDVDVIGNE